VTGLAVIGAGVMGTGIAALALGHGWDVLLLDDDPAARRSAETRVADQVRLGRLIGALPSKAGSLVVAADLGFLAGERFAAVVESVVERPAVKRAVLAAIPAGSLIATTTSAIPVDELADAVADPADLVGLHFMNPPYRIRAVEVVLGARTGPDTTARARALLAALGARPVVVGDGPGFVVNRVLQRMINEAARIVGAGIADAATVDAAMTECLGHRTGPLATADLIGLDNVVDSLVVLRERTGDEGYRPCGTLLAKVDAGHLGRKTGRGFHDYGTAP
jgi:methoxymalonate biosynthesis protein